MMRVTRRIANGSLGLALIDFERSGYFKELLEQPTEHLHTTSALADAWELAPTSASTTGGPRSRTARKARWTGRVAFLPCRGFTFPGRPNSAPPNLAQHDWIHVLADYGSTVESEIEVFGSSRAATTTPPRSRCSRWCSGLFETGYLYGAAKGFFEYDRGHLSRDADRMALRLGDAMYRGAKIAGISTTRTDETDLLATDWFEHADRPLDEVRADFGLLPSAGRWPRAR